MSDTKLLFNEEIYKNRIHNVLKRLEVPLLILTRSNYQYLTGFRGSAAYLILHDSPVMFVDGRYIEEAKEDAKAVELEFLDWTGSMLSQLIEGLKRRGIRKVALDPKATYQQYKSLSEAFSAQGLEVEVYSKDILEELRSIKDELEVEAIRRSLEKAEAIMKGLFKEVKEAASERISESHLAAKIYFEAVKDGYGYSFDPIVGFDANSAKPHYKPESDVYLKEDSVVLIDMGVRYQGYCSDITRTSALEPSEEFLRAFKAVKEAQEVAISKVRDGVPAKEVDLAAREVLRRYDLEEYFVHSTGHGVGLDIHEYPRVSASSEAVLKEGMVITIEPGVYFPGKFGIRLEQMVVVRRDGAELLNSLPLEPDINQQ